MTPQKKIEKIQALVKQKAEICQEITKLQEEVKNDVSALYQDGNVSPQLKKKVTIIKIKKKPIVKKIVNEPKVSSGWAIKFDCCKECGTTERKHLGKGFCANCYMNNRNSEAGKKGGNKKGTKKGESKWSRTSVKKEESPLVDQKPMRRSSAYDYECRDCNEKFKSVYSPEEGPGCPKCSSVNVAKKV